MDVRMEIVKLIKFSPKRENMFENIKMRGIIMEESHDDLENNDVVDAPLKIKKFSATRWTMRHVRFICIQENHKALLNL